MENKILKIIVSIACLSLLVLGLISGCLVACNNDDNADSNKSYKDRAIGNFNVRFYDDYCEILGTTEQGNNQKYLVVPEYIEGVEVKSFGAYNPFHDINMTGTKYYPLDIVSNKLEKVYFQSNIEMYSAPFNGGGSKCPNLKKVMYLSYENFRHDASGYLVYYPRNVYEEYKDANIYMVDRRPANVSYQYNYEGAKNGGYYWIDDCDYGAIIEFIPPEPTREGYTFGGWYKEPECINKWNFEIDTLPQEQILLNDEGEQLAVYQETILYAKWI